MSQILRQSSYPKGQRFQIVLGDITAERVDAIVNAANAHLAHGGGLAGILSRKGGSVIQEESDRWVREHGPVSHESPAYTNAGKLPCRYVIHVVGPVWGSGDEDAKLAAAVRGALETAASLDLESISLPAISTGIFGFPKERAAGIFFETVEAYLTQTEPTRLQLVRLVLYDQASANTFLEIWDKAQA
jgi:putative ATPase